MRGTRVSCRPAVAASALLVAALGGFTVAAHAAPSPPAAPQSPPVRSAGGKIFDKWCSDCHHTAGGSGSMALQRTYQGRLPAVLEQRTDLLPAYIQVVVRHGMSFMPSFRKTEISDADLALVAAYLAPSK